MPSPISLYIHWPFCKSKCPYCDFNSHVRDRIDQQSMLQAYLKELHYFKQMFEGRTISTIFFGGGTPSLAAPEVIAGIISEVHQSYNTASDIEITMEANPTSIEAANFAALAEAGVNRISIGIQSLQPDNLKFLGREHSPDESLRAIEIASHHFKRYSLDFIYTLPNQKIDDWMAELEQAYALSNGHLSLYQLTIEKGTKFYQDFKQKKWALPDDDQSVDFYTITNRFLQDKGLLAYEVSNYAHPGNECRHNLNYWNYGDYIGIGAGAHGRYTLGGVKHATQMYCNPEQWLAKVQENGVALQQSQALTANQMLEEKTIMGMRLNQGISSHHHLSPDKINFLCGHGLLVVDGDRLKATDSGRLVLNSVLGYLLTDED